MDVSADDLCSYGRERWYGGEGVSVTEGKNPAGA